MENFDLKKYLVENKLTAGSRLAEGRLTNEELIQLKLTPEEKKTLVDILVMKLQYYRGGDWPAPGEEFFAEEIEIVTNILNKTDNLILTPEEKSKLIYFLDMEIIKAASDRSINTDPVKTILNKLK